MSGIVQVAGIIDKDEAAMLATAGVDWLGFPFWLPVHKEDLTLREAARIVAGLPSTIRGVLITYLHRADEIVRACDELGVCHVQLHGPVTITEMERLRSLRHDLVVVKSLVIGVRTEEHLRSEQAMLSHFVDYFLTDTHDPATGADGATGRTHDWAVSHKLAHDSAKPLLLAGGLDEHNVADAITQVRPHGVDAHTRLEGPDGRKVEAKVQAFVDQARRAFTQLLTGADLGTRLHHQTLQ